METFNELTEQNPEEGMFSEENTTPMVSKTENETENVTESVTETAETGQQPEIKEIPNDNEDIELGYSFTNTGEIDVPPLLIDQILGQEQAVEIVKKAARQRRHVMMIGTPGTGKSLLAKAMAELLPKEELEDILVYPNAEDSNNPRIRRVPAGKGREIVAAHRAEAQKKAQSKTMILMFLMLGIVIYSVFTGAILLGIFICLLLLTVGRQFIGRDEALIPKLLVSNYNKQQAPYVDATAAHAGALLGDVRHDPFQSGGLETPAHDRVEAGDIHKSHKGVLFMDEINILSIESQQSLLTALQEKEYAITGQSERSSGALVKTEPVPCDFIMVAAGNIDALEKMHPALRSRIKGYGYEVYMRESIPDTPENRDKFIRFVAQEVMRDGNIPQFDEDAVKEIIREAKRRSGRKGQLTLKLRDLGGLVRVAGDLARADNAPFTTAEHVLRAKKISRSIEQQLADRYLENKKDYESFFKDGGEIGRVNGLAVIGGDSGIVLPILSEVTPSMSGAQGNIIATGQLKTIAREAVKNVSAVIKKVTGKNIEAIDIHIQFVGTYEGVEGDSASISIATAVLSAYEKIPVNQSVAMTGSLSVRGDVLPVGGVTYKIEAAAQAGIKKVIIPKANEPDVMIEDSYKDIIEIIPVSSITEVAEHALVDGPRKEEFLKKLEAALTPAE
ncbi:Lon protease [Methanimicrococcus stummii]|uniref:Archaeal Lon protease n=1 Tax=Methanimicrococcus stummii TaxID=3028294 RepID=A0AA96V9C0_9EURY|nr:ATP-dependent protease LonB [Methanimicrococcus sp. Es2]WNY28663.1 Lon protease [Methanimicrococcus sp. Es2]